MNNSDILIKLLEEGIKKQLDTRLAVVVGGTKLAGALTWAIMKYAISPLFEESYELIAQQFIKRASNARLEELNETKTDDDFRDIFLNL